MRGELDIDWEDVDLDLDLLEETLCTPDDPDNAVKICRMRTTGGVIGYSTPGRAQLLWDIRCGDDWYQAKALQIEGHVDVEGNCLQTSDQLTLITHDGKTVVLP